ncbi:MAG: hypothetical protein LBP22_17320 [Deltaproteobacteria bacterium]|nr:hypothetical protein [Deltaproteobacteria bacterium]
MSDNLEQIPEKKEGHSESDLEKEPAKASKEALKQIVKNGCAGPIRRWAKEITCLSVAVYGRQDIRVIFATEDLMKPRPAR